MEKPIKATLKEAVSTKSGKPYQYVSLMLTDTYEKKIFLDPSEEEILRLASNMEKTK